ncbi:MAG: hypothetical protein KBT36_11800 [Kurthia sp.]|nr:hypothetical protein [Candidatus Kurthia equi]
MSETTATALKFAAGIILAIVLVAIAINVFTPASDSAKAVTTDFAANTTELKDQKYLIYDGTVVSGSQVISALRKFENEATEGSIALKVETGKNNVGTWYYSQFAGDSVTPSSTVNLANTTNVSSVDYINSSGMFNTKVTRDSNGVIRAITFTQQVKKQ